MMTQIKELFTTATKNKATTSLIAILFVGIGGLAKYVYADVVRVNTEQSSAIATVQSEVSTKVSQEVLIEMIHSQKTSMDNFLKYQDKQLEMQRSYDKLQDSRMQNLLEIQSQILIEIKSEGP